MRASERLCRVCGGWHRLDQPLPHNCRPEAPRRGNYAAPRVQMDTMDLLWHPHDGAKYDSKAVFRAVTRAAGAEEVGDEVQHDQRTRSDASHEDVRQAVAMLEQGYKPDVQSETLPE